jgi:hypothetical protein
LMVISILVAGLLPGWAGAWESNTDRTDVPLPITEDLDDEGHYCYFTENIGQWDDDVLFFGRCGLGSVTILEEGIVYSIDDHYKVRTLKVNFQNGKVRSCKAIGEMGFPTNYLIGSDPEGWVVGAISYEEIVLEEVWEDVDIRYRFNGQDLKYDVLLGPRSDHRDVTFNMEGHEVLEIGSDVLSIGLSGGIGLVDSGLMAYDPTGSEVPVGFKLIDSSSYGFELERRPGEVVTIDPLVYSTYFGGSYDDGAKVVTDTSGSMYLVGATDSTDYPVTPGSFDGSMSGWNDISVTKLTGSGRGIIYSTYIGGTNFEFSPSAFADEKGYLYVTGGTSSIDFPTTLGAFQEHNVNTYYSDIFVLKLNVSGDSLIASSYISGDWYESTYDIQVMNGNVYLCGQMESHDFPSENGHVSGVHGTAFFMMMDGNLSTILDSAFWDTPGSEMAKCLDVDSRGAVVIGGTSSDPGFPVTPGAYRTNLATMMSPNIFIIRYDPATGTVLFSSLMGGYSSDIINDIVFDRKGDIYFAGATFGYGANHFPTTQGAFDGLMNGTRDGIVGKLSGNGTALLFSTLVGGDNEDYVDSIVMDAVDRPFIAGHTNSASSLPVTKGAFQTGLKGGMDCFMTTLTPDGASVLFSTYLGGSLDDLPSSIAMIGTNLSVVCGTTSSTDFPTTNGPLRGNLSGGIDIFLSVLEYDSVPSEPRNLTAISEGVDIFLEWDPPTYNGSTPIVNYSIYRGVKEDNLSLLSIQGNQCSLIDTGTEFGVEYFYSVSASNLLGEGPMSGTVSNTTLSVPGLPRNLTASAELDSIILTWDHPMSTGGCPLSGYTLFRQIEGGHMSMVSMMGPKDREYVDVQIKDGIQYTYNLTALNKKGPSTGNATVSIRSVSVPTPPRNLTVAGGNGNISLSWEPPEDSFGSALVRYRIYRTYDTDICVIHGSVPGHQLWFDDLYLENGRDYSYHITAENMKGESAPSRTVTTFPRTVPSAPTALTCSVEGNLIRLEWGLPEDDGGMPVLGYSVLSGPNRMDMTEVSIISSDDARTYLDPAPYDGVMRFYSITCFNAVGPSEMTAMVCTPEMGLPLPPLDLKAVPGDSSIELSWDVPSNDGGAMVLSYMVHRSMGVGPLIMVKEVPADGPLGIYDQGLTNGMTYTYRVSAVNMIGGSMLSDPVSSVPVGLPDPPTNVTIKEGDGSIKISWNPPTDDGGSAIRGYMVLRGKEGTDLLTAGTFGYDRRVLNDTGLINGEVYFYALIVMTDVGGSDPSGVVSASPCSTPGKVDGLSVELVSGSVLINWSPPVLTGGRPIIGYEISRRTDGNGSFMLIGTSSNVTRFLDPGPAPGRTYEYSVVPFNMVGKGVSDVRSVHIFAEIEEPDQGTDLSIYLMVGGSMLVLIAVLVIYVFARRSRDGGMVKVEDWCDEEIEE